MEREGKKFGLGSSESVVVLGTAATPEDIIAETAAATISERSATCMDDRVSEAAMEERKKAGYF